MYLQIHTVRVGDVLRRRKENVVESRRWRASIATQTPHRATSHSILQRPPPFALHPTMSPSFRPSSHNVPLLSPFIPQRPPPFALHPTTSPSFRPSFHNVPLLSPFIPQRLPLFALSSTHFHPYPFPHCNHRRNASASRDR